MFPLIFCSLCAQKLWRVRTFLEMTNVCATTHEQKKEKVIASADVQFFVHQPRTPG